jgi:type III polyketide synthase
MSEICELFHEEMLPLAKNACLKAIHEWGGSVNELTHIVTTCCTDSSNPGFDHYLVKELGMNSKVQRVLLHGVGCSGGLAALRTAANIALGATFQRRKARILVLACELTTSLARLEIDTASKTQEVRAAVALFSDCASALVLSNGIGEKLSKPAVYELLGWTNDTLPDSDDYLRFDAGPMGVYLFIRYMLTLQDGISRCPTKSQS